jgi:hypothetical protein
MVKRMIHNPYCLAVCSITQHFCSLFKEQQYENVYQTLFVRHDFHVKTIFASSYFVGGFCCNYVIGVQHDIHIRYCSCLLTVTRRVPLLEHELLNLSDQLS